MPAVGRSTGKLDRRANGTLSKFQSAELACWLFFVALGLYFGVELDDYSLPLVRARDGECPCHLPSGWESAGLLVVILVYLFVRVLLIVYSNARRTLARNACPKPVL